MDMKKVKKLVRCWGGVWNVTAAWVAMFE